MSGFRCGKRGEAAGRDARVSRCRLVREIDAYGVEGEAHVPPPAGRLRNARLGIDAFVDEERGSTTLAAAVAILVSLVLVFGLANVAWTTSRAADVQAVADAGALAGANVLAGYVTAAQVIDAVVLSMGLVGMTAMGAGLVLSAIPVADVMGPPVVTTARQLLESRRELARSAATGLQKLETAVPYLMAANSLATVRANATDEGNYVGLAIPFPLDSATDFGLLTQGDALDAATGAGESSERIDALEKQAAQARAGADAALERAWRADCRDEPNCLRERAATLAGLGGALNPDYPSVQGWDFGVPIARARAYYAARIAQEMPAGPDPLELTRSRARAAFYRYALEEVEASRFSQDADGSVLCDLHALPANTDDVRGTRLYTDVAWPCTNEPSGRTIHSARECPGAQGPDAGLASLRDQDGGAVVTCGTCQFTVVDMGRVPAASTSIENGFEHHWRAIVQASEEYEAARNEQVEREREAQQEAERARDLFAEALEELKVARVSLAPPGRYGCVCVVADPATHLAPGDLATLVGAGAKMPARAAISAATLTRDGSADGGTVLGGLFDALVAQSGLAGVTGGMLDGLMTAWGDMLKGYNDSFQAFSGLLDKALNLVSGWGAGSVSSWLRDAIEGIVGLSGLQPADLSVKRPVLTNTEDVMSRAGQGWYNAVRALVLAAPSLDVSSGVSGMLEALGVFVESLTGTDEITVAELRLPGSDRSIPLTIDLGWLASLTGEEGGT